MDSSKSHFKDAPHWDLVLNWDEASVEDQCGTDDQRRSRSGNLDWTIESKKTLKFSWVSSAGRKNLGSRVALLPKKFLRIRKVFARITKKPDKLSGCFLIISHFPDIFTTVRIFQITSHLQDGFKTVRIFSNHFPFSGGFQNCADLTTISILL